MRKKILSLIVLVCFVESMVSCANKTKGETQTAASQTEEEKGSVFYYREEKSVYEEQRPQVEPEGDYGELQDYCEMADGDIYYLYEEQIKERVENSYYWNEVAHAEIEHIFHIIRYCQKEASFEEIELSTEPDFILWKLSVSGDGTLLVFGSGYRAYVYPPGERESQADFPADPYRGFFFLDDSHLVCQPAAGSDYMVFDIRSGEKTETYISREFLNGGTTNGGTFLAERQGEQLLVTGNGIYEKEGDEWSLKVPSGGTSMGLGGFIPNAVWKEGDAYCLTAWEVEGGGRLLFCYSYSLAEKTGETIELRIFSVAEDSFLKKAALEYQLSHPEVVITYTFAGNETPKTMQEMDTLYKRVNTEIVSEKAADVYMLDWLPWEDYAEKGYLLDLGDVMQLLLESGDYFEGVLSGYSWEEGIYAMPLFFQADMVMGKNEVMPYTDSLAAFAGYLEKNPGAPGLVPYYYRDNITGMFLPMVYSFYEEELYEEGRITEESLAAFLDGTKTLYDRLMSGDEAKADYNELYEMYTLSIRESQHQLIGLGSGSMDLVPARSGIIPWLPQVFHYEDYFLCATGRFHPCLLMGVHSRTAHPKEAEDFLRFLAEYTGIYTDWARRAPGIAVKRSAVALWMDTETAVNREGFGWDIDFWYADEGEDWPYYLPVGEKDAERVEALLSEADTPAASDANALTDPVYELLLEEVPGFLAGEKSLEKTVDDLYGRLSIIQSEKE